MYLREPYRTINEAHVGNALQLPPPAPAVLPAESRAVTDAAAPRDGLDISDLAHYLKVH